MNTEGGSAPPLVVRSDGSDRSLPPGPSYVVGRDPESDIVITDARVSWRHAVLRLEDGRWVLADDGSTNGTYAGDQRVDRIEITGECQVRLGHPADGPVLSCTVSGGDPGAPGRPSTRVDIGAVSEDSAATPSLQPEPVPQPEPIPQAEPIPPAREPSVSRPLPSNALRIGRAPDNDIVVSDPAVSSHHAELRNVAGAYWIVDLDSTNGTFVNGQRVADASLTEGDVV
jgi:ABC transport system ATP-binding/permease protein